MQAESADFWVLTNPEPPFSLLDGRNSLHDVAWDGSIGGLKGDFPHELLSSINNDNVQLYSDWANVGQALLEGPVKAVFFQMQGLNVFVRKTSGIARQFSESIPIKN